MNSLTNVIANSLTRQQRSDILAEINEEHQEALKLAKELDNYELDMSWDEYYDSSDNSDEFDVFERPNRSRDPGMTLSGLLRQQLALSLLADIRRHVDEYGY